MVQSRGGIVAHGATGPQQSARFRSKSGLGEYAVSDPLIGRTLGKYLVQQEIGRGGMARVYRASDTVLQRPVALKVLTPALSADPDFAKRFEREAITAANLRHPAIVIIFDVGEADGLRYIAMEYIGGRTLDEVLRERGRLGLALAVAILAPLAEALDFAHATGRVHRDIKPHNIMLDTDGRVLLTDFGIAIDPSEVGDRLTRTGTFMGTPEYISPEQAQAQPLTGRSDLYSLGIVAYEMLAGRVPFEGGTPQQIMAHVYQPPPPLTSIDPQAPPELDRIFARMLSKDPAQRFDQANDFVAALRSVQQQLNQPPATREELAALAVAADSSAGRATVAVSGVPLPATSSGKAPGAYGAADGSSRLAGAAGAAAGMAAPGAAGTDQAATIAPAPGGPRQPIGQGKRQPTGQGYSYAGGDQFVPPPRVPRRRYYEDDDGGSVPWSLLAVGAVALVAIALLVLLTRNSGGSTGGNPFVATATAIPTETVAPSPSASPSPSPSPSTSPSAVPFPTPTFLPLTPDPSEVVPPTAAPPTAAPPTAAPPTVAPPTVAPPTEEPTPEATVEPTLEPSPSAEAATPTAEAPTASQPAQTPTAAVSETPAASPPQPTGEASPPASSPPPAEPAPSTPLPSPPQTETPPGVPTPVGGGGRLAFFQGETLLIRDIDNKTAEPVNIGGLQPAGPPAISPDGATVLLDVRNPDTNARQIMALNGDTMRQLTQGPGENFNPSWRADGGAIVFASSRNGSADLYIMDPNGANQRAVTSGPGDDVYPSWRPDGTRIAFESNRDGNAAIFSVDPQGGEVTRVSPNGNANYRSPRWSPDGTALAFVADRDRPDGGFEVYIQQLDGDDLRRVSTFSSGSTDHPAWSPDGTLLAFAGDAEGSLDIYVVDLANDLILPSPAQDSEVDERYPTWE